MATIKIKYRRSTVDGKEGTVYFKVIHNRIARQVNTGYKLLPHEWDDAKATFSLDHATITRKAYLEKASCGIVKDKLRLGQIVQQLDMSAKPYTADNVVTEFHHPTPKRDFIVFAWQYIGELKAIGKPVAQNHATALRSFIKFHGNGALPFSEVNGNKMMEYEAWLKQQGLCRNSTSCYMRNLHAIYNHAVEEGVCMPGSNPFRHVYTGIDETQKRAVVIDSIKLINDADLSSLPKLAFARDLFMFSFLTRGMSFVDMCYLTSKNLNNGFLAYRRRKCGQLITIKWEPPMEKLIRQYKDLCYKDFLLPIITTDDDAKAKRQYKSANQRVNNALKKLGEMLGLPIKLTTYVARHSWATAAQKRNISLSTISRCMGHKSEEMTSVYLASIDTSDMDDANNLIIKSLGL